MENVDYAAIISEKDKEIDELKSAVLELNAKLAYFIEQIKLTKNRLFGVSSEKMQNDAQLNLFGSLNVDGNDVQNSDISTISSTETTEIKAYIRKKHTGKREADLSKLPQEVIEYNLSDEEKICSDCGETMGKIGVDDRKELKIIPPQIICVVHRREVCKCENCAPNSDRTPIVKANAPDPLISGSIASPSAVSYIITQKYLMHLPLYRLEQDFLRRGVFINRQNMSNWIHMVLPFLEPVYNSLKLKLLAHDVIHSDDTVLQVLNEPDKTAQQKSSMWIYRTSGDSVNPIAIYEYQPNRKSENIKNFLGEFSGYCHTDGFIGYHNLENITIVGCWAHLRRKFNDAYKITKVDASPAKTGLDYCNRLFELERKFADMTANERYSARLEFSKPVADEFFVWADSVFVAPKTAAHTAVTYAINQRKWLNNVFLDGRLELSNNRAERSVKPFVIGRKNWLFSNSQAGAKASAVIFSIIETAKENNLNPYEYMKYLLEKLPDTPISKIDELLPWSIKLPPVCYAQK